MSEDVEGISQCRNRVSRVLERLVAGRSSIALEQIVFHQLTEDVSDRNVAFLDAGRVCRRHCDGNVGRLCEETAILAGKTDGFEVLVRGLFHCRQHVRGIAACADADGDGDKGFVHI
jgi:hypothetical protein